MLNIYVIYHDELENMNMFFIDMNKAQQKIKELESNPLYGYGFRIRVLKEGEFFDADMAAF
jgi:hypothetical protein